MEAVFGEKLSAFKFPDAGKIQGNFPDLTAKAERPLGFPTMSQLVTPKFPTHPNREFCRANRELFPAEQGKSLAESPADGIFGKERTDDREDLQNRWNQSIQLDQEPAIVVRKPGAATHLTPQNDQLMSECRILCLKPASRLEWRGQDGKDEAEQCKHYALTLGDSFNRSNADEVFGTHRSCSEP